jgi:hypothetical protein
MGDRVLRFDSSIRPVAANFLVVPVMSPDSARDFRWIAPAEVHPIASRIFRPAHQMKYGPVTRPLAA